MSKMKNIRKYSVLILIVSTYSYAGMIYTNYVNQEDFPVKITVPYYAPNSKKCEPLEIKLQKGDLYEARKGKNGIIYPKYSLLPDALLPLLPKEDYNRDNKNKLGAFQQLRNVERFINIDKIPADIVSLQKSTFNMTLDDLVNKRNIYQSLDVYDLKMLNKILAVTNNYESMVGTLSDPSADPDEDGFNNAKEAEFNTNPLIFNELAIGPSCFKVDPQNNLVVTSFFSVINNSLTNYQIYLKISNHSSVAKDLFKPRLLLKNGYKTKNLDEILSVEILSKSEEKIGFLAEREYLPLYFSLNIDCYVKKNNTDKIKPVNENELYNEDSYAKIGSIEPVLVNYECPLPSKPVITSPVNGWRFILTKDINLRWKDNGKPNKCDGDIARYFVKIYRYDEGSQKMRSHDFLKKKSNFKAKFEVNDDFYEYYAPGIFFWRALKVTASECVSFSDWHWFVIGKEIGPRGDTMLKLKKDIVYHKIRIPTSKFEEVDWYYEFDENYINLYETTSYFGKPPFNMYFLEPLPKGIIKKEPHIKRFYTFYISADKDGHISVGTYTNHFVISDGKTTLTNMHIFSIKRSFE